MSKDYRKKYEIEVGRILPSNWHIHHIDHDREKNNFGNLIALPDLIHQRYHMYMGKYNHIGLVMRANSISFNTDMAYNFINTLHWVNYCHQLEHNIIMTRKARRSEFKKYIETIYEDEYEFIKENSTNDE